MSDTIMPNDLQEKLEQVSALSKKWEAFRNDFPDVTDQAIAALANFKGSVQQQMQEGRRLSIAIVGRVKSGKSTLLNALLFDGENILPNAATPMTAALTFVRYAPECRAEVTFFSPENWNDFCAQSKRYEETTIRLRQKLEAEEIEAEKNALRRHQPFRKREITDEFVRQKVENELGENCTAAQELVSMAKKMNLDVSRYLGTTHIVAQSQSPSELTGKLEEYVGAGGLYTPIVHSTVIYYNDPRLEGYEIIDTPGMNDPIISRGKKTTESLAKTDVVLVLSPAGRFFDQSDLELLSQNLPRNGIDNFLLLASQYDSAVSNIENQIDETLDPFDRLCEGMAMVQEQLSDDFAGRVNSIANKARNEKNQDLGNWEKLGKLTPICVSSLAFTLSRHWDRMTAYEKEQLEIFNTIIHGFTFNQEILAQFSRISKVKSEFERIKAQKQTIIEARLQAFLNAQHGHFAELGKNLQKTLDTTINAIQSKDIGQLEQELKTQTSRLEKGRSQLEGSFEEAIYNAHAVFDDILSKIRASKSGFTNFDIQTESHNEDYTDYEYRGGLGIIDFFCGPKAVTRTRTVTTRYADVYSAVDQVEAFANSARHDLESAIRGAVDMVALKQKLNDAVLALFGDDLYDVDIDILREQLKSTIRKITIPDADFGDYDQSSIITSKFCGSRVEESEIDGLKKAQREALQVVINLLDSKAKDKMKAIEKSLNTAMTSFVNQLIANLQEENRKLSEALKDKEASLAHMESLKKQAIVIATKMNEL